MELNRRPSNQSSQQSFKLPEDFAEKIDEIRDLKAILEELKKRFSDVRKKNSKIFILKFFFSFKKNNYFFLKETNKRSELENIIANLNNSLDNIRDSLKECLKNTQLNKEDILVKIGIILFIFVIKI